MRRQLNLAQKSELMAANLRLRVAEQYLHQHTPEAARYLHRHAIGRQMSEKEPSADVLSVLLCDDTRREENGKDIIIGVYTGNVLVDRLPADLVLCLWIYFAVAGAGDLKREIRVINPSGEPIAGANISVTISGDGEGFGAITLRNMPLHLDRSGFYTFQWRKPKSRWTTILEKRVDVRTD